MPIIEIKLKLINKRKEYKIESNKCRVRKTEAEIKAQLNAVTNDLTVEALDIWQTNYEKSITGRHTFALIPNLEVIYKRKEWHTDYYITQALTGHVSFPSYLFKFKKIDCANCGESGEDDVSPMHTLLERKKHEKLRKIFSVNSLGDIKILNKKVMGNVLFYFREIMKETKIDSV